MRMQIRSQHNKKKMFVKKLKITSESHKNFIITA